MPENDPNNKLAAKLLHKVSESTYGLSGKDFVLELTKKVAEILEMEYCFVAECANADKSRLRTVAFVKGRQVLDNIEYNTSDSGCSMMMKGDTYFLPEGAYKLFPAATGIEAYVGAPIISPVNGEIMGHLAATDTHPIDNEKDQTAVLKIFASRIASELVRIKAEKELENKNSELQKQLNEIQLYQFTLQNLHEDIYWINAGGKIIKVNESACRTSGYSREELMKMSVFDLNPTEVAADWPTHWNDVKNKKKVTLETRHRHKEGHLYDVEVTNNYIVFDGIEFSCSVVRDIRKRKMEEELLLSVSEATSGVVGQDYFRELAKFITLTLGVKYALVSECANEEKTRLRTISYVENDKPLENIEYDLKAHPAKL
jgi:PAS domain S-box-containing protein